MPKTTRPKLAPADLYNAHPRAELRRTLDDQERFARLERQGLLDTNWRTRLRGMRFALQQPMRLYAHVDKIDADGGAQLEAQCAARYDAASAQDNLSALAEPDFFMTVALLDTAALPKLEPDAFVELQLHETGEDRPLVYVRWTPPGDHPALSPLEAVMRLGTIRTLPAD